MNFYAEYIKTFGDRFVIATPGGYYCGSITPYCGEWERARAYKSKSSALNIVKKQKIEVYSILPYSSLIKPLDLFVDDELKRLRDLASTEN